MHGGNKFIAVSTAETAGVGHTGQLALQYVRPGKLLGTPQRDVLNRRERPALGIGIWNVG